MITKGMITMGSTTQDTRPTTTSTTDNGTSGTPAVLAGAAVQSATRESAQKKLTAAKSAARKQYGDKVKAGKLARDVAVAELYGIAAKAGNPVDNKLVVAENKKFSELRNRLAAERDATINTAMATFLASIRAIEQREKSGSKGSAK